MLAAEQLETRKNGMGGADAAAILGLNPYRTAVDVYLEKMGQAEQFEGNDATHWGNVLEDVIAKEYARRTGNKVQRRNQHFVHPDHYFMMGNIDRWVVGEKKGLECKTAGQYVSDKWGESGTDQVPDDYLIQCAHYMSVLNVDSWDLAVLIGGRDFRIYHLQRDPELENMLIEQERDFWENHVLLKTPPEPVNLHDLEQLYPNDNGETIIATPDLECNISELKLIKADIKALEEKKKEIDKAIRESLADNSFVENDSGNLLATYKKSKDFKRTDWKATFYALSGDSRLADYTDILTDYQNENIQTITGSRRLILK